MMSRAQGEWFAATNQMTDSWYIGGAVLLLVVVITLLLARMPPETGSES